MTKKKPLSVAQLVGFSTSGDIVYQEEISLDEYYDGEHIWDNNEGIKGLAMVRLVGRLFDDKGNVYQEFESSFCPDSGDYIGGRVAHEDGQVFTDGTYGKS